MEVGDEYKCTCTIKITGMRGSYFTKGRKYTMNEISYLDNNTGDKRFFVTQAFLDKYFKKII